MVTQPWYTRLVSRSVAVSVLKAKALGIVEEVARTGEPVTITKRGKPVAQLVPMRASPSLIGSVTSHVSEDDLLDPTGEQWEAEPGRL